MSLSGAINTILTDLGYYDHLKEYCSKFKIDIGEIEEIVEEFKAAAEEYKTIITFLVHVDQVEKEITNNKKDDNKNSVILSTIHGVKGMEFKNIFIINCNEENIPHLNSIDKNIEEERRLFYVGITRTIEKFVVMYI
jgi:DNA helicase-2/ATP-dependent DNA helicase PcrA